MATYGIFGFALLGGVASFISPCVLPLVPAYVSYASGLAPRAAAHAPARAILPTLLIFVLGFGTVFVLLGASASIVFPYLGAWRVQFNWLAGAIIMLFGLYLMGLLPWQWLSRSWQIHISQHWPQHWFGHPLGAFVLGICFAFGWTPCIGPILASILLLAGQYDSLAIGMGALAFYAAGLGIPFVLVGLGLNHGRIRKQLNLAWVQKISGGVLLLTGALVLSNYLQVLGFGLLDIFPALGRIG